MFTAAARRRVKGRALTRLLLGPDTLPRLGDLAVETGGSEVAGKTLERVSQPAGAR
jgi:hypothetical protein